MKNKVLLIGGYQLPQGNASAVRVLGNARLMRELGYEPIIIGKFLHKEESPWHEYDGIRCFDIECASDQYGKQIGYMDKLTETVPVSEIYSMIAYNFPADALKLLNGFCHRNKIAFAADVTEWYAFELTSWKPVSVYSAVRRKLAVEYRMRFLNRKIGNLICSTCYLADYYGHCRTVVIPMIDEGSFTGREYDGSASSGHEIRRFLYAGSPGNRFHKDRIDVVIKQFSRLKEKGERFRLDIYGVTEEQYREVFPYHFENSEQASICFHGRVERSEIMKALENSDYYVLYRPNTQVCRVGFSTKAMEATSNRVVLIANDINGDFKRYYRNGQALLCGPSDEEAFYNLLLEALAMPQEQLTERKRQCLTANPFHYRNFIEPVGNFMREIGNAVK